MSRHLRGHTAPLHALRLVDDGRAPIGSGRDARICIGRLEPDREGNRP